ncbi:MAG: arginase family protein [Planctomycetota bacterium]
MSRHHSTTSGASQAGLFGCHCRPEDALIRILPVPFDATCSYGSGTAGAPAAILQASPQLDLWDPHFGAIHRLGVHLEPIPSEIVELNTAARALAAPVSGDSDLSDESLAENVEIVNQLSEQRSAIVEAWTQERLSEGVVPGTLGGDHSCPLGAIRALASAGPLSILHLDAHLDLRIAYQGFRESHASVMHNVLEQCASAEGELARAQAEGERVVSLPLADWARRLFEGEDYRSLVRHAIGLLGDRVYVSFDIDCLEPALCPHTGTPVPGGFTFQQAAYILGELGASGRRTVGFDLCEVAGAPDSLRRGLPRDEYDANVGARILYKLCGLAGTHIKGARHPSGSSRSRT